MKAVRIFLGVLGIGTAGYFAAEPLVRYAAGEFTAEAPVEPEKVHVDPEPRGPVHLVAAFDVSCSDIKKELPGVVASTARYLEGQKTFTKGDLVTLCSFAETPDCKTFDMGIECDPKDPKTACGYVTTIKPECNRPGQQTFVHQVAEKLLTNELDKNPAHIKGTEYEQVAVMWSDFKEEDRGKKVPLAKGHSDLVAAYPLKKFAPACEKSRDALGYEGVNCLFTTDAQDLGSMISARADRLDVAQKNKAKESADARNTELEKEYAGLLELHREAQTLFEDGKKAKIEQVEEITNGVRLAFAGLLGLLLALNLLRVAKESVPKLKGCILDLNKEHSHPRLLPETGGTFDLQQLDPSFPQGLILAAKRGGVSCKGRELAHGEQIAPGIFYFSSEPDYNTIKKLREKNARTEGTVATAVPVATAPIKTTKSPVLPVRGASKFALKK